MKYFTCLKFSSAAVFLVCGCSSPEPGADGGSSGVGVSTGGTATSGGAANPGVTGGSGGSTTPQATGGSSSVAGATSGGSSNVSTGGAPSAGGTPSTGGTSAGGTSAGSGGATSTGGTMSGGGVTSSGGSTSGGSLSTGGTATSGGTQSQGGSPASGGSAGKATGGSSTGGASTGGTGTGGTAGATGATPDCNSVTGQKIITVARDGSGQFTTVQAAINSVATSNTTPTQLRIKPDTYKEKLVINRPFITLCGQAGKASTTILTYSDNANTPNGNGGTLGTSGGTSTNLTANDVSAENVTFENSTALGGSQAVAILISGSRAQFRNCRFMSYQDTLYVHNGTQYFKSCYIQGTVDYIFGGSTAVFDGCTMYNASGGTAVTAPSTDQATAYGLVFLGGSLTAASGVSKGSMALGRNWGAYGAAAYIKTALGAHISAVGWVPMGTNTLATARFSEFQNTGDGASTSGRAAQSTQLTTAAAANYTIAKIFGSWTPSFSR